MTATANGKNNSNRNGRPHALLRAGFPFYTTIGMRRVTTYPMDVVIGDEDRLYVLNRTDGSGGQIRRTNWDDDDLDILGDGFMWPVQMIRDENENLYVSDEGNHTITVWRPEDGAKLDEWGQPGSENGQLNRPSGISMDLDGNMLVVDTLNHRVQTFTRSGNFISSFGEFGTDDGQFNYPWGIAVDQHDGAIYVTDWRNDRLQKFDADGSHIFSVGSSGDEWGNFNRPAGVTVDRHGDVYVADRGNNRVQQFDCNGRYVDRFIGDAVLSKSGRIYILSSTTVLRNRESTELEEQRRFRGPASVRMHQDPKRGDLLYVADFGCHRIQIYRKEAYELDETQIAPVPTAPTLYTV